MFFFSLFLFVLFFFSLLCFYLLKQRNPASQWACFFPPAHLPLHSSPQELTPSAGNFLFFSPRHCSSSFSSLLFTQRSESFPPSRERREHPRAWTRMSHVSSNARLYKPPSPSLRTLGASPPVRRKRRRPPPKFAMAVAL